MFCCPKGHLLTRRNARKERSQENRSGFRIRCKTCVSEQKRRWYASDAVRTLRLAYDRHYRNGHPQGLSWPEAKAELVS